MAPTLRRFGPYNRGGANHRPVNCLPVLADLAIHERAASAGGADTLARMAPREARLIAARGLLENRIKLVAAIVDLHMPREDGHWSFANCDPRLHAPLTRRSSRSAEWHDSPHSADGLLATS